MAPRALFKERARWVFGGKESGLGRLALFVIAILVPSPVVAPLVGEEVYFRALLEVAYLTGLLFLVRNLIRWPRWLREIHHRLTVEKEVVEPETVKSLAIWMLLELFFACYWATGADQLRSHALVTTELATAPLPLWFFGSVVLLAPFAGGLASKRAAELGLRSTATAVKQSRFGKLVPEAVDEFHEIRVYREAGKWFSSDLPGRTISSALALIGVVVLLAASGAAGYLGIHAVRGVEQKILHPQSSETESQEGSRQTGNGTNNRETCTQTVPGEPAPAPRAEELYALWYGGPGIRGFGNDIAGCPLPATPEPDQPSVWLEQGRCRDTIQGLAVSSPYGAPAMLLQQAAREGARLGEEGVLLSASHRHKAGEGDLYVLQTTRAAMSSPGRSAPRED